MPGPLRPVFHTLLAVVILPVATPAAAQEVAPAHGLDELLRNRIEASAGESGGDRAHITVGTDRIHASRSLPRFYERRGYEPAWVADDLVNAEALLRAIRRAELEGLRSRDYHLRRLEESMQTVIVDRMEGRPSESGLLIDLDLLLTDAFLIYGSHLLVGRVDPTDLDPEWIANRRDVDMVPVLEDALRTGLVEAALVDLLPPYIEYRALRDALARHRRVQREGGWPRLEAGGTMRPGDRGEQIPPLRARLAATRDLDPRLQRGDRFDDDVEQAVRRFQDRHGLAVTGVVDLQTLMELTAPVEQRIEQIIVNMERWRWLPQDLGRRHARVNVAGFDFSVYEDGAQLMRMRAMVGHQYRRTPVFSDTITLVVFAPWWNVPASIAVNDVVPRLAQEGPGYAARNRIHVTTGWGASARRVDPATVDWAAVDTGRFQYRFRQEPGPTNPLGNVKFMFPNAFDVYVHDTPAREMFQQAERAFSSGCIRIERPEEFAEYLLRGAPGWTSGRIAQAMAGTSELSVRVPEPLPIHILYWTAWAGDDGRINFRNDIYQRDEPLERALEEPAPSARLDAAVWRAVES